MRAERARETVEMRQGGVLVRGGMQLAQTRELGVQVGGEPVDCGNCALWK